MKKIIILLIFLVTMPLAHAGGIPRLERNDRYVYDTNRGPMTLLLCGTPSVIIYGADPVCQLLPAKARSMQMPPVKAVG